MRKLKTLIRSLVRNKVTSVITIIGFSVSISMALVLIAFLINEFSYDKYYPNIERIYRVFINENVTSVREDFRENILGQYPEIENVCLYNNFGTNLTYEDKPYRGNMIATDTSFFNIFSIQFINGSTQSSLNNLNDVVITESFARKIFGDENPVGKTLVAEYREPLVVSGIIKDFSDNSSIQGDFITNSKLRIIWTGSTDVQGNNIAFFRMFILVKDAEKTDHLQEILRRDLTALSATGYMCTTVSSINLIPFAKSYFMQGIDRSMTKHANLKLIQLLSIISIIIILLAVFNYINLSTATHSDRLREIGIKKTIGAERWQIFSQFISESFFICFISFMLAMFLAYLWAPFFEKFLGSQININTLFRPVWIGWLIIGVFMISVVSGFYPALSISKLKPLSILRKKEVTKQGSLGFRAVLNILQYTVSVSLIITLIVLSRQIEYVRTKDFGFDADQLLRVDVHWSLNSKADVIREKLLNYPSVKNVCFSHGSPGSIYSSSSWDALGEEDAIINQLSTDTAFFKVFQIPLIQGRKPLSSDFNNVCYINETAYKKTGWTSFEGKKFHGTEIIGIVKDFNFANLYNPITPLVIPISSDMGISHVTLRISPENIPQIMAALQAVWSEVCAGHALNYQFYDQWLDSMYKKEERLTSSIRLFAVLAIMISCLGILGLAEFSIKKRMKEIGIRKVNGAKVSEILAMLNKDFIKWVAIAFVIATPIAYYTMHKWLENFAYKTNLSWWIFALAGLLALGIALLTVSFQSWKAATKNPVESLRYE
ncbi:MAG: ABC transporter permease [Mariniphaga sp.]|nr:ABC transporter permease [Mariniphaga sp.]